MAKRRKPARRTPGSGYITPLADGRAKAHYPKPEGGYFVKRCDSLQDAERWLGELAERDKAAYDLVGGQQRLETWLSRWVELQETDPENPLKAKTIVDYRFKLGYVISLLGKMVLSEIKPDHADDALRLIRKKLAANTANQIQNLFWRTMEDAVTRDYIERNPVRRPLRRRKRRRQDTRAREVVRLTPLEATRLLAVMAARREALAWWLLVVLGLREGEVLGLRRCDIDLERCTLTIAQQYTQLHGRAHKETPKTEYAERVLPFPRALLPQFDALLVALERRGALAAKRGTWEEHDLLFPGRSGRPMNPSSLLHMLKRALPAAELPKHVNVHHLRHTAAKFYTDVQAPDIVRVALAGHSPKTITDYYGEPDIETLRPWVERVYLLLAQAAHQGLRDAA